MDEDEFREFKPSRYSISPYDDIFKFFSKTTLTGAEYSRAKIDRSDLLKIYPELRNIPIAHASDVVEGFTFNIKPTRVLLAIGSLNFNLPIKQAASGHYYVLLDDTFIPISHCLHSRISLTLEFPTPHDALKMEIVYGYFNEPPKCDIQMMIGEDLVMFEYSAKAVSRM